MVKANWTCFIDWNNDNDFSDTGENVTARVQNTPGIVCERGRDQIRALAPPMAGRFEATLNNASKDYSPEYASSPLYGNLVPGRSILVRADDGSNRDVWRGVLDDLPQEPFLKGGGRVRVPGLGKLAKLKGTKVTTDFHFGDNITTSAAIVEVLVAAGLTASDYTMLDTGKTTLTAWWCNADDAFDMLRRLLAAEGPGAAIYEQADGRIAFHSRHYRLQTARSNTSQVTFGNATTEPKHSPPFTYEPNLKDVVNSTTVTIATLVDDEDFDNVDDLLTIPIDPPVTIQPAGSAAFSFQLPTIANLEGFPAGSGFAEFPEVTTVGPDAAYSVSLDVLTGHLFTMTITSTASYAFAINSITIRGRRFKTATGLLAHTVDTSASQAKYGVRTLPGGFSPWPYIAPLAALDLANSIVVAYREPRPTVTVTLTNANSTRLTQQLTREISDRVTVVEAQTGLNAQMYIERIRHEVREGGRFHRTTFGCEKAGAYDDYFLFDVDNFDGASFGF